jgi:hypothetical protein
MPHWVKILDLFTCTIETMAIHAKFKTGSLLFTETHQTKAPARQMSYNPQRDFAMAQAQLSRFNR